jgi:AraC family transcriptional regulator
LVGQIDQLRVSLIKDEAGLLEFDGSPATLVAIHVGPPTDSECRRGGERFRGRTIHGDIEIVPPMLPGTWETRQSDTALIVGLGPRLLRQVAEDRGADPDRLQVINRFQARDPRIEHLAWALKVEMEQGYPCGRLYTEGLAMALAATVVNNHSSLTPPRTRGRTGCERTLRLALEYIEAHLDRDIGLSDVSHACGVSVSTFTSAFRRSFGVSPHQYLIRRRVERAASMLRQGKLSVGQIAAETGFCHQSHLARHVRRLLGMTPQQIRDAAS